jgi:SET domain-containing protein
MFLYRVSVGTSTIAGKGLFADEPIAKGAVIALISGPLVILTEEEYDKRSAAGNSRIVRSGERLYGNYFYYSEEDEEDPSSFINHSTDPNCLRFAGFCFALKDIQTGEEITADYTLLLSKKDVELLHMPPGLINVPDSPYKIVEESLKILAKTLRKDKVSRG